MIGRLHSGRFWLKTVMFLGLAASVLFAVRFVLMPWLFSPQRLQQMAAEAVAGTGRAVRFQADIGYGVFPRPTVVLKQVSVSRPNNPMADIHIDEMRVGISWSSLFGTPSIEKWVLVRPEAGLSRGEDGRWNVHDLMQKNGGRFKIDRLSVEGGRVLVDEGRGRHSLSNIELKVGNADGGQAAIRVTGRLDNARLPEGADWKFSGILNRTSSGWQMPSFSLSGGGRVGGSPVTLALDGQASWIRRENALYLGNARLKIDIEQNEIHLTASAPSVRLREGRLKADAADAVLTAGYGGADWNASVTAKGLVLWPTLALADQLSIRGGRKTASGQTTVTLDSPLVWQHQSGLGLPDIRLATRRENTAGNPRPRLIGELAGSWFYRAGHWQGRLAGKLDREDIGLHAAYSPGDGGRLSAGLQLDKLNLSPYLDEIPADGLEAAYPAWLSDEGISSVEAEIHIGTVQSPNIEINRLDTRLLADGRQISLPDFSAELYGGRTEGEISITNTRPLTYHLKQYAANVQIRPMMQDLFRYGNISGRGNAVIDLTAQGADRKSLTKSLSGNMQLNLNEGAWLGLDLDQVLQNLFDSGRPANDGRPASTPFERFSMGSTIEGGISRHQNAELYTDRLHLVLNGSTDLNTLTLNQQLKLSPAAGPGKAIPLNIRGTIEKPSFTLDYSGLTQGSDTPAQRQQAMRRALREQWQWLNRLMPARGKN
ncbi:MAG: AsmA family protein [Neisseria sp.]|nr:AsmA family protein [Neisseria sp.]